MIKEINTQSILSSIKQVEPWNRELEGLMSRETDRGKVYSFLDRAVTTYQLFEQFSQNPWLHLISSEKVKLIKAIWIPSAPGTYFTRDKTDRYQDKPWSYWADRKRINYAFSVGRQLAEIKAGKKIAGNTPADLELLKEHGPILIYNGRSDENAALAEATKVPWLRIPEGLGYPQDKVFIINPLTDRFYSDKYNLLDQVRTLRLPADLQINPGDEIGIVAHAPQAVRALYSLNIPDQKLPEGIIARMFLLPTPDTGMPDYPLQELRGLVYYRFIDEDAPRVGTTPYKHIV